MAGQSKSVRERNRALQIAARAAFKAAGLSWRDNIGGGHMVVTDGRLSFDFYAASGKWRQRAYNVGSDRLYLQEPVNQGLESLISYIASKRKPGASENGSTNGELIAHSR